MCVSRAVTAAGNLSSQVDLGAAIRTFDQALARQLEVSATVRALLLALQFRCLDGVEHSLVPVDIATEEPAADQLLEIALDFVLRGVQLQYEVGNRDLAASRDNVEQFALIAHPGD